jgi:hypothetical protein
MRGAILERKKYCCDGLNAKMYTPYKPIIREGVKYFTAVYICHKCHEYTLRGETNQKKTYTTFVNFISEDKAMELKKRRDSYVAKRDKRNRP